MKRTLLALGLAVVATAARADYPETVRDHILPGYAAFADTTAKLAETATETCDSALLEPLFNSAFDAWMGVQHLNFGPVEEQGRRLAIQYWPDPKGSGAKAQMALLTGDPAKLAPDAFAQQSVAARGLMALERLLYPVEPLPADPCPLIRATATDLAATAAAVNDRWTGGYADTLLTAGKAGNTTFLTSPEVRQVLFTQLASGLEFLADNRIARPLGTFDAPHPERAEARARLIRLDYADGSQRLVDVDSQMAVRNWDANGNFWVPIQQEASALAAIDLVVERPLALIVAPTRELALQVSRELEWLYARVGLRIATCVGGMDASKERRNLRGGPAIVVGTPGRLRDHLERGALDLSGLIGVVLDEQHAGSLFADGGDKSAETFDLVDRQSSRRLVEQQESGLHHESPGNLNEAQLTVLQAIGAHPGEPLQSDDGERRHGILTQMRLIAPVTR